MNTIIILKTPNVSSVNLSLTGKRNPKPEKPIDARQLTFKMRTDTL